jgi:hypothetical protein
MSGNANLRQRFLRTLEAVDLVLGRLVLSCRNRHMTINLIDIYGKRRGRYRTATYLETRVMR